MAPLAPTSCEARLPSQDAINTSWVGLSASLGGLDKEIQKAVQQVAVEMRAKEAEVWPLGPGGALPRSLRFMRPT